MKITKNAPKISKTATFSLDICRGLMYRFGLEQRGDEQRNTTFLEQTLIDLHTITNMHGSLVAAICEGHSHYIKTNSFHMDAQGHNNQHDEASGLRSIPRLEAFLGVSLFVLCTSQCHSRENFASAVFSTVVSPCNKLQPDTRHQTATPR